jgi:hypothetical protein
MISVEEGVFFTGVGHLTLAAMQPSSFDENGALLAPKQLVSLELP